MNDQLGPDPQGPDRLLPDTDRMLQRQRSGLGTMLTINRGGDPLVDPPQQIGAPVTPQVELERRMIFERERNERMNKEVFLDPQGEWGPIKKFMDDVFTRYKTQNSSSLIKRPANQEEALLLAQQMKPVVVDPNEVAGIRQMAVKLDQKMKAIDPRTSFFTDPRTKEYGAWLNREAGVGTAGYLTSGEQQPELGVAGRTALNAMEVTEGVADFGLKAVHGLWDLGSRSIQMLGGPDMGSSYPTNFMMGPDGEIEANGGRAPAFMDSLVMAWAAATNQNIASAAHEFGKAREWEEANRHGFAGLTTQISRLGGELMGMAPMGVAMKAGGELGNLTTKGLQSLGLLRAGTRSTKIISTMANAAGQAMGMGAAESIANGRVDGYGKSFVHGMVMAGPMMILGALGRRVEWFAEHRVKLPEKAAQLVGAAMEGAGFGGMEQLMPNLLPSAWDFVKDPNESTWQSYAKNAFAFVLAKGVSGRTTPFGREGEAQLRRAAGRAGFAEKVARGEATPEEIAKAPVPDEAALRELGHASIATKEGKTPEERADALERQRALETQLDIQEQGPGPAEDDMRAFNRGGPEELLGGAPRRRASDVPRGTTEEPSPEGQEGVPEGVPTKVESPRQELPEAKMPTREEIAAVRAEPDSPERRAKITQMMRDANRALGKAGGKFAEGIARQVEARARGEVAKRKEISEAADFTNAMLKDTEAVKLRSASKIELARISEEKGGELDRQEARRKEDLVEQDVILKELEAESARQEDVQKERDLFQQQSQSRRTASGQRAGPQSLQRQPTSQVRPTAGVEPVRAMDIVKEMEGRPGKKGVRIPLTGTRVGAKPGDPVQTAMRSGGLKGRNAPLGVFKVFENLVRTSEGRDLAVKAHEWSHNMQRHMVAKSGGRDFWHAMKQQVKQVLGLSPGQVKREMQGILKDYPGHESLTMPQAWAEVWAEWHARNLLGEVDLDSKFPIVSNFMRTWLSHASNAGLREQYYRLQDMFYRYNAQGSVGRVEQSVVLGSDKPTETEVAHKKGFFQRAADAFNKAMLDDMADLKKSQDKWLAAAGKNPEDVRIQDDPARLFDALRMTATKQGEHFIMKGIRLPDGTVVPGLRSVMKSVNGKEREFLNYVVSLRNLDLYKHGKEVQLPPRDYLETIKQMATAHPEFIQAGKGLKQWTDALVDFVQRSGGLSVDDAKRIKDAYVIYVPFFRALEGPAQHGKGRGVAERGTGLARIKGSTFEVADPLMALQQVATSMIAKAHQNQVMTAVYKMAVGQEAGGLATIVPRSMVPTEHPLRRILDLVEKKGASMLTDAEDISDLGDIMKALKDADALNPETITTFAQKVIPAGERAIIAYTPRLTGQEMLELHQQGANMASLRDANDKLQWLEVDTKAYEALMGVDKMPQLPESMQPVMKWLQAPRDVVRFFATGVSPGFALANILRDAMSAPLFDPQGKFRPFGGFVKMVRGAIEYHKNGRMRELYEELGVKTSSFLSEGRAREVVGQRKRLKDKFLDVADSVQQWFSHPENYIRMDEFKNTYEAAKKSGKSEMESRLLAMEAGREITVNYARGGVWARVMNQLVPYFNAGLQGQRKLWGQLVGGGADTKSDAQRARIQRGAILNGLANITVPATLLWMLNHNEEWYQDLPEWRKVGYFNFRIGKQIVSVPKPFEAGVLFGSLPELMLDHMADTNPASLKQIAMSIGGPYIDGPASLIPAFLRPIIEVAANKNFFTGRSITPEWISRENIPQEQATFYTTETAKVMSRAFSGILTPTEIEHLMGSYTAGAAVSAMRAIDEISGMKDHPASIEPWGRFTRQIEHGQSRYVDQLYDLGARLEQSDEPEQRGLKTRIEAAKRRISKLRKDFRAGNLSRDEAEAQSYEIARPIVEAGSGK